MRSIRLSGLLVMFAPVLLRAQEPGRRLTDLSLEDLGNIEVTSVSRQAERLATAAASIFVITADDIRRSGATSLAEALRLAPTLLVAQQDATQYAISARGFNNLIANKLLILLDGRTIYAPLFSGVFWDQQDVLLEDVDRIEVITGPGATLWGANAVNGVINITTRAAHETRGALVSGGAGHREQNLVGRYGLGLGREGAIRIYGKATHLEETTTAADTGVLDGRRWIQGGFRADWTNTRGDTTIQGDVYDGASDDRGTVLGFDLGRVELSGFNLLTRVTRRLSDRSEFLAHAYVDHYRRRERVLFQPKATLFDVEGQYGVQLGRHRWVMGGGSRWGRDEIDDGLLIVFRPKGRSLNWQSLFAHDEVKLHPRVSVSGGIRLERNEYTGWDPLPSARVAWQFHADQLLWSAVSRAVRAPARLDREVSTPNSLVLGGPDFVSEVAKVVEVGYRGKVAPGMELSATVFRHGWDRLRSGTAVPVFVENRIEGTVYGIELWASWQPAANWRLLGGGTTFRKDLRLEAGSTDPVGANNPQLANDPDGQWLLRSSLTLGSNHDVDATMRYVGALPNPATPAYGTLDLRYAWRPAAGLELSVLGHDLAGDGHPEFGNAQSRGVFGPGVRVQVRWTR